MNEIKNIGSAIFKASCELILKNLSETREGNNEMPEEFLLEFVPICTSRTSEDITPYKFSLVLNMALKSREAGSLVNVLETASLKENKTYSHHFFISFLPKEDDWELNGGSTFTSFAFLDAVLSGYGGTSPKRYEMIQKMIKDNIDEINLVRIDISDHEEFEELFSKAGPVLEISYPDGMYAITD